MTRRAVCVLSLLFAVSACDTTPPEITAISEPDGWIHDPFRAVFSEPVRVSSRGANVWIEGESGRLGTDAWFNVDEDGDAVGISVRVANWVETTGPLRVHVEGLEDLAGNDLESLSFEWVADPWAVLDVATDENVAAEPRLALRSDKLFGWNWGMVVWPTSGVDGPQMTGVAKYASTWESVGSSECGNTEFDLAPYDSWTLVVLPDLAVLQATAFGAYWSFNDDCGADAGGPVSVAVSAAGRAVIARPVTEGVRINLDQDSVLEPLIPAVSLEGAPQVLLPRDDAPVVAFFDRVADGDVRLRIVVRSSEAWEEWWSVSVAEPTGSPSIVMHDDALFVAWTDTTGAAAGVHVARVAQSRWTPLPDPPGGAVVGAPQLATTGSDWLTVSWSDGSGRTARWTGDDWEDLASWTASGGEALAPHSTAMFAGHAPVVTWRDGDTIKVALFNGPPP